MEENKEKVALGFTYAIGEEAMLEKLKALIPEEENKEEE